MKVIQVLCMVVGLSVFSVAQADTAGTKEAEKLLDLMDMEQALDDSMSGMLDLQLQQNPSLAPYKGVMLEFFRKYMSYESIKPDMAKMYADAFTAAELQELTAFYSTDVGKKTIEKMPELMMQGAQLGTNRIQNNMGELQQMIQAEAQRIQQLQQQ